MTGATLIAIFCGIVLYSMRGSIDKPVDYWLRAVIEAGQIISIPMIAGALLFCVQHIALRHVVALACIGICLDTLLVRSGFGFEEYWKYGLGVGISGLVLSLCSKRTRPVQIITACCLGVVSAFLDTRNLFGILVISATLFLIARFLRSGQLTKLRILGVMALSVVAAWVLTQLLANALVSGIFGSAIAERQAIQQGQSGVLGGRVEGGAFFSLFIENPFGFGFAQIPTRENVLVGKAGMRALGSGAGGSYVDRTMFGGRVELHSIASDLWVAMGLVGLALAIYMLMVIGRALLLTIIVGKSALPLASIYLLTQGIWDVLFSPLYANYTYFGVSLGVALVCLVDGRPQAGKDAAIKANRASGNKTFASIGRRS
ncbi:MAG: hypothetical protein EON54_02160 [Alcaligenaceae bacterium]|nr:MAG: hypothetical protein EON54_02160 [Alcaligenaceae bacterium]